MGKNKKAVHPDGRLRRPDPMVFSKGRSPDYRSSRNKGISMSNGTIKKLVSERGFGFIAAEDGKEYFFHRDGMDSFDSLQGGESVTFEIEASPKGPRANQVKLVSS